MNLQFEAYDPERHDAHTIATLIYQADPELMSLGFGSERDVVEIVQKLMSMEHNQYSREHITCAALDGELVGVIVGFTGEQKKRMDKESGQDWAKAFGVWRMIRLLPRAGKLERIVTDQVEPDEFVVFGFAVKKAHRGHGLGSRMMEHILERHDKVCLDVNIHNERAMRFYQRHGFEMKGRNTIRHKGRELGNLCMRNW